MKRTLPIFVFAVLLFAAPVIAQKTEFGTRINDKKAAQKLVGKHKLSLQWISWEYLGSATVSDRKCESSKGRCYKLIGVQKGKDNSDYLKIDGMILTIDSKQFKFQGAIETQVSHINGGKRCVRSGDFTFKITGKRKYWRLVEMNNPCDPVADYVDIYFR